MQSTLLFRRGEFKRLWKIQFDGRLERSKSLELNLRNSIALFYFTTVHDFTNKNLSSSTEIRIMLCGYDHGSLGHAVPAQSTADEVDASQNKVVIKFICAIRVVDAVIKEHCNVQ